MRVIAVATSNYSLEVLKAENPDYVFKDLTDTPQILEAILKPIENKS